MIPKKTAAAIAVILIGIASMLAIIPWMTRKPVAGIPVTQPLPAQVKLVGRAGRVEIFEVRYSNSVFLVTSVGEILKP